jgi:molybdopterin-guanine dinucleotide biosynthesis protein A
MTALGVTGIVLAGGASTRFGGDKLAAQVGGRTLLELAVAAVASVSTEVLVVVAPGDDRPLPSAAIPVRRIEDPERHGGPLVGLLAGLEVAAEPIVLVVGGDMPALSPDVLSALIRALEASPGSADAAVLLQRSEPRPLPAVLRNGAATPAARRLLADGERSLRALVRALATRELGEGEWRGLDPEGATLIDVDRPEDLPIPPRT